MDFDRWLQRFATRAEKILFRLTLIFVVLLFIVQAVLMEENLRHYFSKTDQLEGKPVLEDYQDVLGRNVLDGDYQVGASGQHDKMALVLQLLSPPDHEVELFLLINSEIAALLGNENLYIPVAPGDMLEVVGSVRGDSPAVINVLEVFGEIKAPEIGHKITTFGERELLAWIIPKKHK